MSADLDNQPYDNVEFPIRRTMPDTSKWALSGITPTQREAPITRGPGKDRTHNLSPVAEGGGLFGEEFDGGIMMEEQVGKSQKGIGISHGQSSSIAITTSPRASDFNHVLAPPKAVQLQTSTTDTQHDKSDTFSRAISTKESPSPLDDSGTTSVKNNAKQEFTWSDFTPMSQDVFENAYARHEHFNKFSARVLRQGTKMKNSIWDVPGKPGETMTYEQLLQGVLTNGEKLLLGGSWLYFQDVEFLGPECSKQIKPPLGEGRICLTNLRMLLVCAEMSSVAAISEYGNPATLGEGGYRLKLSKLNNVYFQNIPIDCFQCVELSSTVGTMAESKLNERKPACCGLFSCVGIGCCGYTWDATPPFPINVVKRVIRLGVYLPPWRTPAIMLVHLHPKMSLTSARDFVTHMQNHVPQMQYHFRHGATVL